jgi:GDP-fucose transporter C1
MLFVPLVAVFEYPILMNHRDKLVDAIFWAGAGFSGFMGFCNGLVTVLQVTVTSPLTHNISGTAKAAVQSIFALCIWGNPPTTRGLVGTLCILPIQYQQEYCVIRKEE